MRETFKDSNNLKLIILKLKWANNGERNLNNILKIYTNNIEESFKIYVNEKD
jgi:hypothetical protein